MKSRLQRAPHRRRMAAIHAALAIATATASAALSPAAAAADMNAVNNAAKIASSVGAGTAVPSVGVGAVLQTLVGLAVVVALVFACAWLARRLGLQPSARGQLVRTVGGVSLGGKERVAVVEIGDTWLVLGAAPGNVRLLHTMPAPTGDAAGTPGSGSATADGTLPGTFGSRFRDALAGEAKKRFSRPTGGGK
ncbi:flagellar biosynthetic protein FliO [Trinickia sp.]|uniref:flagellar biosynthetic protein FliO n=1 Tax=Trinickia sp. TaxID=2571163 RepID=UPI003F7D62D9